MLRHLDVAHDRFGLSTPFRISRGVKTAADVVTVTIAQGTAVGRGEAVPYARYGEGIEDTMAAIRAVAPAFADGACRKDLATLLPGGAARNAIDCALWDLEARLTGRSVAALAGLPEPVALPSAITIGLDTPDAMARAAAKVATEIADSTNETPPFSPFMAFRSRIPAAANRAISMIPRPPLK